MQGAGTLDCLPAPAAAALRQAYHEAKARNLFYIAALEALAAARIRLSLLKAVRLALTVYPHLALRPMDNLDLLVAPKEVRLAPGLADRALMHQKFLDDGPARLAAR